MLQVVSSEIDGAKSGITNFCTHWCVNFERFLRPRGWIDSAESLEASLFKRDQLIDTTSTLQGAIHLAGLRL